MRWRPILGLEACHLLLLTLFVLEGEACDDPWKEYDGACWLFADKSKKFNASRDDCYSRGGFLASIRSTKELQFVVKTIQKFGTAFQRVRWFAGLFQFDPTMAKNYRWLDGSVSNFRYWMRSQPNNLYERCAQLDGSAGFKWRDDICTQPALYFCRKQEGAMNCYDKPQTSYIWKALDMSVTLCLEHCRGRGYPLAGVKPDRCFCMTKNNAESSKITERQKCDGFCQEQHCGKGNLLAVYDMAFYPDKAKTCEELTTLGIYHPATYLLKNDELPAKKVSCFGHGEFAEIIYKIPNGLKKI